MWWTSFSLDFTISLICIAEQLGSGLEMLLILNGMRGSCQPDLIIIAIRVLRKIELLTHNVDHEEEFI